MSPAQKKKPGHVIRVDPQAWKFIEARKDEGETVTAFIRRMLGLPPRKGDPPREPVVYYILPEAKIVEKDLAGAKGAATLMHARLKVPLEKPKKVIVVE